MYLLEITTSHSHRSHAKIPTDSRSNLLKIPGSLLNISICKDFSSVISFITQKTQITTIQHNLRVQFFLKVPQELKGYTLLEVQIFYVDRL